MVSESVTPRRGGAETSTAQFIQHLLDQGLDVDLYTRSRIDSNEHFTVHSINTGNVPRALKTIRFSRRVDQLLSNHRYDIVHAITPCLSADIYQPRGGTLPESIERNLAIRNTEAAKRLKKLANWLNLKQQTMIKLERELICRKPSPIVIAISDYVRAQLDRHYGTDKECIRRIFNGVDFHPCSEQRRLQERRTIREMYGIAEDQILALLVAHNFKLKGVAQWLRALRILAQKFRARFKTVIIGKANARPYRRFARSLEIEDLVMFAGCTQRISVFFSAADICVHPTYYDPCSRVVLESILHGVPVVTTRYNGAAEVIEDGVDGRVIDSPSHIQDLADAAEQLTAPGFRVALHERHDRLVERLSMKRHATEMVKLYHSIATGAGPAQQICAG